MLLAIVLLAIMLLAINVVSAFLNCGQRDILNAIQDFTVYLGSEIQSLGALTKSDLPCFERARLQPRRKLCQMNTGFTARGMPAPRKNSGGPLGRLRRRGQRVGAQHELSPQ
jgi:hypothetical protein